MGFCGPAENHQCIEGFSTTVGFGSEGFENIVNAFKCNTIGKMARVIIVNPLHPELPRLCILATSTCNKFNSEWVRMQWTAIVAKWNIHCRSQVGPILGHASDGDARRRKLMLYDYSGQGSRAPRQCIGWEGWVFSHSYNTENGDPTGLHDQDFIHNAKKLINPLDSPSKVMHIGNSIATLEHIEMMYKLYTISEHGLNHEDLLRTDRQNWSSAQRLCNRKVVSCLEDMRVRGDGRLEMTLATEVYLSICADYIDIFLNHRLDLRSRIVKCAKVSFFF